MSDNNIVVILAKANWCGHCQRFSPVFEYSSENYKNNEYLKNYNIKFESYDLADDDEKRNFMLSHLKAYDKVDGYPTVLILINKDNKINYHNINHVEVENIKDKKQISSSSKIFIENISNALKSLNSENKSLFLQIGGNINNNKTLLSEEKYRNKYLKYKSKYLNLKK